MNGSGIGLGHLRASTGARIMVTLLYMKNRGKTLGHATPVAAAGCLWQRCWKCSNRLLKKRLRLPLRR
ncbi:MAG: hypothetical protein R2874_11475 [Desulfobacterales bacterium]